MTAGADWADSARRLLDAFRLPEAAPAEGGAHGVDCRWCPVCQAAAVLRGERPEVTAALADVLATTASVLRDLAGEPRPAAGQESGSAGAAPDDEDGPGPAVQRIDIA
ncbi:hypothetical protein JKP75_07135 [Blastococcus sp. TML/M2B]|uniref:hypothetical protein n=1 Tax=unclassified Blastococcus TaxID=2619396 RepID=UPI00190BC0BE|nr:MULTISPECIES: hypothetical protein [unclassified Blastococcus]MBN1092360.1 hypothetical protein [Blastococcus sp. TML/M2B]MBN1097547.1 hypothetical protein [Blastococcus sp. TML/C7B]